MKVQEEQRRTEIEFSPHFRLKLELRDFSIILTALRGRNGSDAEALAKQFSEASATGPTYDARYHVIVTGRDFTTILRALKGLKQRDAAEIVVRLEQARAKLSGDYSKQVSEYLNLASSI